MMVQMLMPMKQLSHTLSPLSSRNIRRSHAARNSCRCNSDFSPDALETAPGQRNLSDPHIAEHCGNAVSQTGDLGMGDFEFFDDRGEPSNPRMMYRGLAGSLPSRLPFQVRDKLEEFGLGGSRQADRILHLGSKLFQQRFNHARGYRRQSETAIQDRSRF